MRARAVRMVTEHQGDHASQWAAICSIAAKIGCSGETLRSWVRQAERDQGLREGMTSETRERLKALERENRELRQANEILRKASAYFPQAGSTAGSGHDRLRRRSSGSVRGRADLQGTADRPVDLSRPSRTPRRSLEGAPRVRRDAVLCAEIRRASAENFGVYGLRKV